MGTLIMLGSFVVLGLCTAFQLWCEVAGKRLWIEVGPVVVHNLDDLDQQALAAGAEFRWIGKGTFPRPAKPQLQLVQVAKAA